MPFPVRVLFVCLHGAAKSVIATETLHRLAAERGLSVISAAAGIEPDDLIPPHVVAGLAAEGLDVADLPGGAEIGGSTRQWADVPAVSDGYGPARDAIVARVQSLVEKIERNSSR